MVKYPNINIPLVGEDGNAFSILARCQTAMKRNGLRDKVAEFHAEATSGDYDNLLRTVMAWFSTDSGCDWAFCDCQDESTNGCPDCGEKYAVGGCPACGWEG